MTDEEMDVLVKQLFDKVFASIPTTVYVYPPAIDQEVMREAAASPEALDLVPARRMMQAIAEERAATEARIVAWLQQAARNARKYDGRDNAVSRTLAVTAERIERGEHRREEER